MSISRERARFNAQLLEPDVQAFIKAHEADDVHALSLRHKTLNGIPFAEIAQQIAGRSKARHKLPTYRQTENIIYPPSINLEQCSSERTAGFKAELLRAADLPRYHRCVDLTGGLGVDTLYLSRVFDEVHFVEPDSELLAIARHNHSFIGSPAVTYHTAGAREFLSQTPMNFDLVYLDPSRRAGLSKKRIDLKDCSPDITSFMDQLLERTDNLLLKASPLLDIQRGLKVLPVTRKVFVVAVNHEVKELLFLCSKGQSEEPVMEAVNLLKEKTDTFSFLRSEEQSCPVRFEFPLRYLYEPNAAILKAGAFKCIADRFNLYKLHPNTHLYTSNECATGFPGRVFVIQELASRMSEGLMKHFPLGKGNVVVRNYPLRADHLRKQVGLRDGGTDFLIGFTAVGGKMLAAARRVY